MSIRLYCVGIHFYHDINFVATPTLVAPPNLPPFMSGEDILKAAATKFGLRYKLAGNLVYVQPQHIQYLSYTPTLAHDPKPRVTLGGVFPFYGQPLSLIEELSSIGRISQVLQYTVGWKKTAQGPFATPIPVTLNNIGRPLERFPSQPVAPAPGSQDAAFGSNGFPDECEIRVRLMSIYCTT